MPREIVIPRETVNDETVTIARLMVPHGREVECGEPIAEIETSKANIEVEAGSDGFVEWLYQEGTEVDPNAFIGKLHSHAEDVPSATASIITPTVPSAVAETFSSSMPENASAKVASDSGFVLFSEAANASSLIDRVQQPGLKCLDSQRRGGTRKRTNPTPPFPSIRKNVSYDLYRYVGKSGWRAFLSALRYEPGFAATVNYRIGYAASYRKWGRFFLPLGRFFQRFFRVRYGISIPFETQIGPGLNFPHWGGIWLNPAAVLGANVTVGHDVSVGSAGPNPGGHPVIGDRGYLSPGVRITGPIHLGSDVLVTANALVTSDADDGAILVGIPAKTEGRHTTNEFIVNIHPDLNKED